MSLLPGSRLATVIVATRCDKHDPVARQPELLWQIVGKFCGERETERRKRREVQNTQKGLKTLRGAWSCLWTADQIKQWSVSSPKLLPLSAPASTDRLPCVPALLWFVRWHAVQGVFPVYCVCVNTHKRAEQHTACGSHGLYKVLLCLTLSMYTLHTVPTHKHRLNTPQHVISYMYMLNKCVSLVPQCVCAILQQQNWLQYNSHSFFFKHSNCMFTITVHKKF